MHNLINIPIEIYSNSIIKKRIGGYKMQCPYFKKVNFHRIEQRLDIEQETQKQILNLKSTRSFRANSFQASEQSIPEEGLTNDIKVESYNKVGRYDSFNYSNSGDVEDNDKIITIKMPKSLKIKQLNIQKQSSVELDCLHSKNAIIESDKQNACVIRVDEVSPMNWKQRCELSPIDEEQVSSESDRQSTHKQAKVFQTHRNLFFQTSFYGVVLLPKSSELCFCSLDQYSLKIILIPNELALKYAQAEHKTIHIREHTTASYKMPQSKTKYFVDLKKYKIILSSVNSSSLNVTMIAKGSKQSILIEFMSEVERCTFQCVYSSILDDMQMMIKQGHQQKSKNQKKQKNNNLVDRSLKSERSIDSLKFQVQRMTYREVVVILESFDIILFKGKNLMCKVQRFFTNSSYDHVGLVIKSVQGNLLLLEATGNVGVAIYNFSSIDMALRKKLYERIAIRKFTSEYKSLRQKNNRLITLQQFIREVNGKKYKFDPMYLLSSSIQKKSNQISQEQTYFCSELVAEALKVSGVMKKTKPSYKYLPKHFGDPETLNNDLIPGNYYSDPIILEGEEK